MRNRIQRALIPWGIIFMLLLLAFSQNAFSEESEIGPVQQSEKIGKMETLILSEVNEVRKSHDKPPLEGDETLNRIAREYSRKMIRKDFFSHSSPSDQMVSDRLTQAGLDFHMVAENLAMNRNVDKPAKDLVAEWMDSPSHRKNILNGEYTLSGIGIWREKDLYYFTQIFLRPWDVE